MQYFSKDEYAQQLPRCAGCLQDFDLYQYPCQFSCKHIYCTLCLKRLKEDSETYKCLYDGCLTSVVATKSDIGFYNRIDYFRRFVLTRAEMSAELITQLDQIKREVNYKLVACRNTLDSSQCEQSSRCPYDHSLKSLSIAQKFRDSDVASCWVCKNCMLTVSRRLKQCPVCESAQEAPKTLKTVKSSSAREDNRGTMKVTNATLDLSLIADEEKPESLLEKKENVDLSSIHEKKTPKSSLRKQEFAELASSHDNKTPKSPSSHDNKTPKSPLRKQESVKLPSSHGSNAKETPPAQAETIQPQSELKPATVKSSSCCQLQ